MLKKSVINADNEGKVFVILTWFDSTAVRCSNTELKLKTMVSETIIVRRSKWYVDMKMFDLRRWCN